MAIPAVSIAPLPSGAPSLGVGQPAQGPGDAQEPFVVGLATITGDGATLAAVVNWVDGTLALPFIPSSVLAFQAPGGCTAAGVLQVEGSYAAPRVTAITATSCTVNFTTAVTNAATAKILIIAFK